MFTFLRKIRKSLVGSGSTQKYLLYAVGEIALVVIGILIALQINNWNERKKSRAREHQALTEIISDLDVSISSLDNILYTDENNIDQAIYASNVVLNHLNNSSVYFDSLAIHFRNVFNYPDVDLKSSGFESLTSMGMDLISDDQLRSDIGKYYSFIIPIVDKANKELRDDFYKYMIVNMQNYFVSVRKGNRIERLVPKDFGSLKKNDTFKQSLIMYLDVYEYYKEKALITLKAAQELKDNINKKINNS